MISTRSRALGVICLVAITAAVCMPAAANVLEPGKPRLQVQTVQKVMTAPAGAPCDGISYDSNDFTGLGWFVPPEDNGIFLQKYTPTSLPFRPTAVCLAGVGRIAATPYDVVIYSDANGQPGSLIARVAATPAPTGVEVTWMTTLVASAPTFNGPFWAGWANPVGDLQVGFAAVNPLTEAYISRDGGATFAAFPGSSVLVRVAGVSGSEAIVVPTLSGFGLTALVSLIAAAGFLAIRKG